MTNDRDLDRKVRTWLDEPPPGPPDRDAVYARVVDRLPETHQRRHWWPFQWNPFAAGATRSAEANGPHPQGRSRIMLNATRIVAAAAVLGLAGSLALVAGPFAPTEDSLSPASEARSVDDVATVTGQMLFGTATVGERTIDGEIELERGGSMPGTMMVDDERLKGTVLVEWSADHFGPGPWFDSPATVYTGQLTIENDDGTWVGPWHGITFPRDTENDRDQTTRHLATMTGSGAYEGLSALVYVYYPPLASVPEVEGLVFPGELPESPG